MPQPSDAKSILTVNAGSSSLRIALYADNGGLIQRSAIAVDRIGQQHGRARITATGDDGSTSAIDARDHAAALAAALDLLQARGEPPPAAVGHRIVHGGADLGAPARMTPAVMMELRRLSSIDPTHMPQALDAIDLMARRFPGVEQVVCFDTSFHGSMPRVAQMYPLPRWTWDAGIRRYGFHGLSCEFIVSELERMEGDSAGGRLLIAHLGNGASVTAVRHGASVDTTMGFSPTGGLMMGTRSGDLDPAVLIHLARTRQMSADALEQLVTRDAGLLAVSAIGQDMRDLLSPQAAPEAREAVDLYCYIARKHMGALAAVLNGLDTLVFTGGIGEHAPAIRQRICAGLTHLGIDLDTDANTANRAVISRPGPVTVRVMQTDEDLVIARHVQRLLSLTPEGEG